MTISTDTKCRELLERLRWPDGIACPRCGSKGISSVHKRPVYDCNDCRHQFSVGCVRSQDHETQRDDVRLDRLSLARRHLRDQPVPARKEQPALVGQRDVRAASTAHPEVLSQLVNRRAESRG